ncbi:hypothetical protein D9611_010497 [Ephemerocybe angulata]|uniref:Large ribosomal subunit protein mL59 domain-containing protein n=1 Tax=Ephemerocybe angulata TaxID=980116 RepID=A0A8H5BUW4_9AGAR|nr:hypothetical protein D9611_010497 [Tulosesus angulatus]
MASTTVARKSIEGFLSRELRSKGAHVNRFGPLPPLPATASTTAATAAEGAGSSSTVQQLPNPFLARYNVNSKRWAPAKYSLRQQADLVKKAKAAGLAHLLPSGPKTPVLDPKNEKVQKHNPHFAAVAAAAFEAQEAAQKKPRQKVLPIKTVESWTAATPTNAVLNKSIYWEGKIDLKQKAGADIGIKLYAGKKRMFKGHRWERLKVAREKKRVILMRDMAKRIRNYKNYYKKKRPDPLKPAKVSTRPGKLPF